MDRGRDDEEAEQALLNIIAGGEDEDRKSVV